MKQNNGTPNSEVKIKKNEAKQRPATEQLYIQYFKCMYICITVGRKEEAEILK